MGYALWALADLFKMWLIGLIILTIIVVGYGNSSVNAGLDAKVASKLEAELKFTPSYINSKGYWYERDIWYMTNCPGERKVTRFCESRQYTHTEYMEHKFSGLRAQQQRIESGDKGGIARFFKLL